MLIANKGAFSKGFLLLITFVGVFLYIMSPSFNGRTGLQFSDDFFNMLSKHSADYFPEVKTVVDKLKGKVVSVNVVVARPDIKVEPDAAKGQEIANKDAQTEAAALIAAGAQVDVKDNVMSIKADLGVVTGYAMNKSLQVFNVKGEEDLQKPENIAARKQIKVLWKAFGAMIKPLQREKYIPEAKALDTVMRKAIEPAYNFYGVDGEPVSKNIPLLVGLLAFYVLYTLWYGFSIFFMFEGLGLSMSKAKVKKEA